MLASCKPRGTGAGTAVFKDRRVSAIYACRLERNLLVVRNWMDVNAPKEFASIAEFDLILEKFVQSRWDAVRTRPETAPKEFENTKHSILALQNQYRFLKGHLANSWDSMFTWRLDLPVCTRIPVDEDTTLAMANYSLVKAFVLEPGKTSRWIPLSMGVLLMFECLARPGEFLGRR